MRLLVALPDASLCRAVCAALQDGTWEIECVSDGYRIADKEGYDVLLLHSCLSGLDGCAAGNQIARNPPLCPPRIVLLSPPEFFQTRPHWADTVLHSGVSPEGIATIISQIAKKPLPVLAAVHQGRIALAVNTFLDDLALDRTLKGRVYAAWLLERLIPSPVLSQEPTGMLYQACAQAHATSAAAVERCLRVAVERIFTCGSLHSIERFFGESADPERGKLTNRAFLLASSRQLRQSLTAARSPNSSEMHHSPAAPTRV